MAEDLIGRALKEIRAAEDAIARTKAILLSIAPTARVRRQPAAPVKATPTAKPLPPPLTPSPRPPVQLSEPTRAENLASVTKIAIRIGAAIGMDSPMVRQSVCGQVALQKIPADDALIDQAIAEARQP